MHELHAFTLAVLALLAPSGGAPAAAEELREESAEIVWDARAARHLLSRAGFGARPEEIERAVERGLEATVTELLAGGRPVEPFHAQRMDPTELPWVRGMDVEVRRQAMNQMRRNDRRQMAAYEGWWLLRMLAGDDPLRDRMTLFWHGFFTSSYLDVRRSDEMIAQHRLLRDNAVESYAALLRGIVRDPAMLRYLDNDGSRRGSPNENLARELLELFSLGEGNYSERDVREVARALTGNSVGPGGEFRFDLRAHDRRLKVVLGERARYDSDAVVELLLRQPACARHVAGRILTYLEGVAPDDERREEYAEALREHDYELGPVLGKLFTDPRFYRSEIVGARVAGPIDYLVGISRRLNLRPPLRLVSLASENLGQALFHPPNVKGWEEGPAWITTASLLQRGNVAGILLGTVDPGEDTAPRARPAGARRLGRASMDAGSDDEAELDEDDPGQALMDGEMDPGMESGTGGPAPRGGAQTRIRRDLLRVLGTSYTPTVNFTWRMRRAGATSDDELAARMASDLLAIEPPTDTIARLVRYLASEREARGIAEGELLDHEPAGEEVLRRLAHLILSSPEAQLH